MDQAGNGKIAARHFRCCAKLRGGGCVYHSSMSSSSLLRSALICASILLGFSADAQTPSSTKTATTPKSTTGTKSRALVYHLTFTPNGSSINFRNYTNAYYIADLPSSGGSATLILTQVSGGKRTFYTYEDFGGMFIAVNGSDRKGVLSGSRTGAPTTSGASSSATVTVPTQNITLYAIGDAKEKIDVNNGAVTEGQLVFPKKLEGSAIFVDSQEDYPFASAPGVNAGSAGMLNLTATYDEGMSANSLKRNYSRNGLVSALWALLKTQGYVDANDTPSPAATVSGGNTVK